MDGNFLEVMSRRRMNGRTHIQEYPEMARYRLSIEFLIFILFFTGVSYIPGFYVDKRLCPFAEANFGLF